MDRVDTKKITGVPETLLIPLHARAAETERPDGIIRDEKAVEMIENIDYDFARLDGAWMSQVGVAVRTEILDEGVRAFIGKHPHAIVINLGAGLCTRFSRVDNGHITWYEMDLPDVIALRSKLFVETDRHRFIARSVTDPSWMEEIQGVENRPVLLIGEGLFMYFEEHVVKGIFISLAEGFIGAEMLFTANGPMLTGRSKQHDAVSKMEGRPEFKWGATSGAVCAEWDPRIRFVQEWNYVDRHGERWRFLRVVAYIPPLKSWMMNKVIHLEFM